MSHPVEPTAPAPEATPVPPPPAPATPPGLPPEALKLIDDANKRAEAAQAVAEDLQKKFVDTTTSLEGLSKDAAERKAAEDAAAAEAERVAREAEDEKLDVKALLAKREEEFNARLDKFQREAEEK